MRRNIHVWEEVLNNLPESYRQWFDQERTYLQRIVTPGASVLEVGCGEGRSIHDLLAVTKDITGIDNDLVAVEHAQEAFASEPSVQLLQAEADSLPFGDATFDFVVCMTTFANFADKKYAVLD